VSLRLLLGADQALGFHGWREPREILKLAPPIVMLRAGTRDALRSALAALRLWSPEELALWQSAAVETPLIDVSATRLRALLRGPQTPAEGEILRESLAPAVLSFIRRKGLYAP
jgi:nicotinic acid mononucleotide adenylyltransferase